MKAIIMPYKDTSPKIDASSWVAPGASVIGDVEIGEDCSIWFGVVIRGDVHKIRIGNRVSVQDLSMIHVTHYKKADKSDGSPTIIGDDVTIGHKVYATRMHNRRCLLNRNECNYFR